MPLLEQALRGLVRPRHPRAIGQAGSRRWLPYRLSRLRAIRKFPRPEGIRFSMTGKWASTGFAFGAA